MWCLFFFRSSVDGHCGDFHVLPVAIRAALSAGVHLSLGILVFSRYMPRTGVAQSYASSIVSSFNELPHCSPECLIPDLHSQQPGWRTPFATLCLRICCLYTHHLLMAILTGVGRFFLAFLIYISLIVVIWIMSHTYNSSQESEQ